MPNSDTDTAPAAGSSPFPDAAGLTPPRYRLSTRIILLSLASLLVVLTMIAGTLWLSWKLEARAPPSMTPAACACAPTASRSS